MRYVSHTETMIAGFADRATEAFFRSGACPAHWRSFEAVLARKLDMLDAAVRIEDLRSPPGNRLEALKGNRKGQWSIRINQQWRICFRWTSEGPTDVVIVDYH
jgi:toxin HigB-1